MKWIEMGAGGDGSAFRTYYAKNGGQIKERVRKGCALPALPHTCGAARASHAAFPRAIAASRTSCAAWCGS